VSSQNAGNGPKQGAGNQFVKFSRQSAQRIAKAVRTVEGGNRDQPGITFDHPTPSNNAKVFRIGTFTGSWSIGATQTVTFQYATNTPNTAAAQNVFVALPDRGNSNCGIAKDGTAWHLVAWAPVTATASVITSVSLNTSGLQFNTLTIQVSETVSTSVITIGTTAC
jgi:hypothetical protein